MNILNFRMLTKKELRAIYGARSCPFCRASVDAFIAGPRGAMSRNMTCASCGARFNILALEYWTRWPGVRIGQLIEGPKWPATK